MASLIFSRGGVYPSSHFRQVTLSFTESISFALSFSTGILRLRSMVSTSKSVSMVPWKRKAPSDSVPPVPDILRPLISMSFRGRKVDLRPSISSAVMTGLQSVLNRRLLGIFISKNALSHIISQPSWLSSKRIPPPPVTRLLISIPWTWQYSVRISSSTD